jgi:hypothetical protein
MQEAPGGACVLERPWRSPGTTWTSSRGKRGSSTRPGDGRSRHAQEWTCRTVDLGATTILRHRYASLLISDGVSPAYVQEQLGHASIELTVGTYGRWFRKRAPGALDRIDVGSEMVAEQVEMVAATGEASPPSPAGATCNLVTYQQVGGERGIRTLGTGVTGTRDFQSRRFNHSRISPYQCGWAVVTSTTFPRSLRRIRNGFARRRCSGGQRKAGPRTGLGKLHERTRRDNLGRRRARPDHGWRRCDSSRSDPAVAGPAVSTRFRPLRFAR